MAGLKEVQAALNAPGLVTSYSLSFNQLKIKLAERLHIHFDDEIFIEHKQAIKYSYCQIFNEVCQRICSEAALAPAPHDENQLANAQISSLFHAKIKG